VRVLRAGIDFVGDVTGGKDVSGGVTSRGPYPHPPSAQEGKDFMGAAAECFWCGSTCLHFSLSLDPLDAGNGGTGGRLGNLICVLHFCERIPFVQPPASK